MHNCKLILSTYGLRRRELHPQRRGTMEIIHPKSRAAVLAVAVVPSTTTIVIETRYLWKIREIVDSYADCVGPMEDPEAHRAVAALTASLLP